MVPFPRTAGGEGEPHVIMWCRAFNRLAAGTAMASVTPRPHREPSAFNSLGKMVYFTYKKLNICTVALLATVFAVLIAAMAVDWYSYKIELSYTRVAASDTSLASTLYNCTQTTFGMFGQTVNVQVANTKIVRTSEQTYAQLGASGVNEQFKIQQAFVLIALLTAGLLFVAHTLYFFDGFRNKILFFIGITALRTILIICWLLLSLRP
jgi:hypothetical protein